MVGGAILELLVLDSVKRWAEQTNKQLPSTTSESAPVSGVLPYLSSYPDFLQ